jgi:hypothetical protein
MFGRRMWNRRPATRSLMKRADQGEAAEVRKAPSARSTHNRLPAQRLFLIFASSACASAMQRTIAAATTANALSVGVVIEGSRTGAGS